MVALLAVVCGLAGAVSRAPDAAPNPRPGVRGVMLISVDGLRPDLVLEADAPNLRKLMARGSYSLWAITTPLAITLPSHTSMLTGVGPDVHGVTWNGDTPPGTQRYPARPTLFELAKRAGYRTAMSAGKPKFKALAVPGTLDRSFVPLIQATTDNIVTDTAARWIAENPPHVLFVHLPGVDAAGHTFGWGSNEQLAAIAAADECIGRLLDALTSRRLLDSTVVLVTADHGGAGRSHGKGDERSLRIPWIIAGPGIPAGFDLNRNAEVTIHTEDTFATLCSMLGIAPGDSIAGRVVDLASGAPRDSAGATGVAVQHGH
jgi:predicted AlkP superfamily pyrophosphatase or phosphodiesterase